MDSCVFAFLWRSKKLIHNKPSTCICLFLSFCYPYHHFIGIRVSPAWKILSGGLSNRSVQPREGKKEVKKREKKEKREKPKWGPVLFFLKKFQPAPTSNARSEYLSLPFILPPLSTFTHQLCSWLCS